MVLCCIGTSQIEIFLIVYNKAAPIEINILTISFFLFRYNGEIGDVVVGRIVEVQQKRNHYNNFDHIPNR